MCGDQVNLCCLVKCPVHFIMSELPFFVCSFNECAYKKDINSFYHSKLIDQMLELIFDDTWNGSIKIVGVYSTKRLNYCFQRSSNLICNIVEQGTPLNCILKLECSTWKSLKIDFNRLWRQSLPFSNDSLNRSFLCLFLKSYTVCFVALSTALPAKSGSSTKGCSKACPFNYDPICAQPQGGSGPKLAFGNDCVLENYNCEHANARKSPLYAQKC